MSRRSADRGGLVSSVAAGSAAARAGLLPGDRLLEIDGRPLRDIVDLQFYLESGSHITVGRDSRVLTVIIEAGSELGLTFEQAVFDRIHTCNNDCLFCFLKGLPPDLRDPLYVKDDDYRLSFTHGNFITLTNLTERDWLRLEEQRLSPLNVSVHATDLSVRRRMLNNPRAPDVLVQFQRLATMGIRVNTQVVLCPGINDGATLDRTVSDLGQLYPTVQSIGLVPVGMTKYAEEHLPGLPEIAAQARTPSYARSLLGRVHRWQREFRARLGVGLVYAADEFYLASGVRLPASSRYDGYPQYENGIGMTRALIDDWTRLRRRLRTRPLSALAGREATLLCGTLIAPVLSRLSDEMSALTGIRSRVVPVPSGFWGPNVTVSGLLTAGDVIDTLRLTDPAGTVFMARNSLDYAGERFLDGGTPEDIQRATGKPIVFVNSLSDLLCYLASALQ